MSRSMSASNQPITPEDCNRWWESVRRGAPRNPHTNYPIRSEVSTVYRRFMRACPPPPNAPVNINTTVTGAPAPPQQQQLSANDQASIHATLRNTLQPAGLTAQEIRALSNDVISTVQRLLNSQRVIPETELSSMAPYLPPQVLSQITEHNTRYRERSPQQASPPSVRSTRSSRSSRSSRTPTSPDVQAQAQPQAQTPQTPQDQPVVVEAPPAPDRRRQRTQRRITEAEPSGIVPMDDRARVQEPSDILELSDQIFGGVTRMSRFEVERYIASRLRRGLNTIIHPTLFSLMVVDIHSNPTFLTRVQRVCDQFQLSYQPEGPANISIPTGTFQGLTLSQIDSMIHGIRINNPSLLRNMYSRRTITPSFSSGSQFRELITHALQYNLDLYHIARRNPATEPVTAYSVPPQDTLAYTTLHGIVSNRVLHTLALRNNSIIRLHLQGTTELPSPPTPSARGRRGTATQPQGTPGPSPYRNLRSLEKTALATPERSAEDTAPSCVEQLSGIENDTFKPFARKLKAMCSKYYSATCTPDLVRNIQNHLYRTSNLRSANVRFNSVNAEYVIATVFNKWRTTPLETRTQFMLFDKQTFGVSYANSAGIGPGVMRSFLQRLVDELVVHKILDTRSGEPEERYFINPSFIPDTMFKQITRLSFDREEHYVQFYTFIGHLLSFVLLNNIPLTVKLSYNILAHMIYKHDDITPDEYIGFAMIDFPTEFSSMINLMRNPDYISASMLTFEDTVRASEEDVTPENFRTYLREKYMYRYLQKPFSEDERRGTPDIKDRFMGLVQGMQTVRRLLRNQEMLQSHNMKLTLPILDKLVSSMEINAETVQQLTRIVQSQLMRRPDREYQELAESMQYILSDVNGEHFPYDMVGIPVPDTVEKKRAVYFKFIEELLAFWSSYRRFIPEYSYNMSVVRPEYLNAGRAILRRRGSGQSLTAEEAMRLFPESHTCFISIDIPNSYHNNREHLYRQLAFAAMSGEAGIGNYGGGKKKKNKTSNK